MGFIGPWSVSVNLGFSGLGEHPFRWFPGTKYPNLQAVHTSINLLRSEESNSRQTAIFPNYFGERLIVIANGSTIIPNVLVKSPQNCRIGFVAESFRKLTYSQDEVGPLAALCLLKNPYGVEWFQQTDTPMSRVFAKSSSDFFDVMLESDFISTDSIWEKNDGLNKLLDAKEKMSPQLFQRRFLWRREYETKLLTALREIVFNSELYKNYTLPEQSGFGPWKSEFPPCRLAGNSPILFATQPSIQNEYEKSTQHKEDLGFELISELCNNYFALYPLPEYCKELCQPISTDVLLVNCTIRASELIKSVGKYYKEILFFTSRDLNEQSFQIPLPRYTYSPFSTHFTLTRIARMDCLGATQDSKKKSLKQIAAWWKHFSENYQKITTLNVKLHELTPKLRQYIFNWIKNIAIAYEKILFSLNQNSQWRLEETEECEEKIANIGHTKLVPTQHFSAIAKHLNMIRNFNTQSPLRIEWHDYFWVEPCLYATIEYRDPTAMMTLQDHIKNLAHTIGRVPPNMTQENDAYVTNIFISKSNHPTTMADVRFAERITRMV